MERITRRIKHISKGLAICLRIYCAIVVVICTTTLFTWTAADFDFVSFLRENSDAMFNGLASSWPQVLHMLAAEAGTEFCSSLFSVAIMLLASSALMDMARGNSPFSGRRSSV